MPHHKNLFFSFIRYFAQYVWFIRHVLNTILVLVIAGALVISWAEAMQFGNAIYFAFITAFTIGYGDITPVSTVARVVSIFIGLVGIIFSGLVVAISTKALSSAVDEFKQR